MQFAGFFQWLHHILHKSVVLHSTSLMETPVGRGNYVVECLPKVEAAVIWGKIVYRIRKEPRVPEQIDYFDEEMVRVRELHFDDVQQIGDRIVPLRMTVLPLEKPEEMTILHYRELVYDLALDETFFSLRNLK